MIAAPIGAGGYSPFRHRAGDGARLGGLPGESGAFPPCREYELQQRFGDQHGHQHGDGDGTGGDLPPLGSP
jgi:hypothetical protein